MWLKHDNVHQMFAIRMSLAFFNFMSYYVVVPFTNGDQSEHAASDNTGLTSASVMISPADIFCKNV